uniref:WAP domain-containing protein n=1 Tax=Heterorhabditis bacteriophora TaxID=37862 RepID=A0A1I7X702_HETBA
MSYSAVCSSNEYCPPGWSVLRKADQSAQTCDPMQYETKCERPHSCVHSKCGISFCCVSTEKLARWKRHLELEQEIEENSTDEL